MWPFGNKQATGLAGELRKSVKGAFSTHLGSDEFKETLKDLVEDKAKAVSGRLIQTELHGVEKGINKEAAKLLRGGFFKRAGKNLKIAGVVLGGAAALGLVATSLRKPHSQLPPRDNSDLDMLEAQLPVGPADGRAPAEWQSRVRPGAMPQMAAINPRMNVEDGVADLGATPVR